MSKNEKIAIILQGGLGNQLFCYSAAFYLAKKNNFKLECVMTSQYNSTKRDDEILLSLKLPGTFIKSQQQSIERNSILTRILRRVNRKFVSVINIGNSQKYLSHCSGYDQNLESINTSKILHGYFQTWRYPLVACDVILLSLKNHVRLSNYGKGLIEEIKSAKSLVVHIRLGDYKNRENKFIGVLDPKYYETVLNRPEIKDHQVYVFSDDISDAKFGYSEFFPPSTIWVDEDNTLNSLETLLVMSHGKAFVIANSTFSWWSAFLSQESETIIAPSKWFEEKEDPEDLIPSNWHREISQWAN